MTRTLHTQPRSILAARRTGAPHRSRGDEPLAAHRQQRLISDRGVELREDDDGQWPRIRVGRCLPGCLHPIGRPAVLLVAPTDHVEAGSAIRTAAAFGWRSVGLDDRHAVWFGVSQSARTEGRAAARSHRNATRVLPMRAEGLLGFKRIVVAGTGVDGRRISEVDLAGGRDTLLVIPDEEGMDDLDWGSLGGRLDFARVELPATTFPYRYRLVASIVLAEAARQIGRPAVVGRPARRRGLTYESALEVAAAGGGEVVWSAELGDY